MVEQIIYPNLPGSVPVFYYEVEVIASEGLAAVSEELCHITALRVINRFAVPGKPVSNGRKRGAYILWEPAVPIGADIHQEISA